MRLTLVNFVHCILSKRKVNPLLWERRKETTMNDKILQIIPAPADMWAVFEGTDADGEKYRNRNRVACLALVEGRDGSRDVAAMVHDEVGYFTTAGTFEDFSVIEFGEGASK